MLCLVTGASRGIGRAIAESLLADGARVAVCASTAAPDLRGAALSVRCDVADEEQVRRFFEQAGKPDCVVINAGVHRDHGPVDASDPEAWRETVDTNLVGAYYCARAAIPHLKQRGSGKIITIGSGIGHRGGPSRSAYACSKAGLWMLTRVLAQELAPYNISVNELIPGPVDTSMNPGGSGTSTLGASEWLKRPEDVVPLALFLAEQPDVGPTAQSFSLMRRDT